MNPSEKPRTVNDLSVTTGSADFDRKVIATPAICKVCAARIDASTTGVTLNDCFACGGEMVPSAAADLCDARYLRCEKEARARFHSGLHSPESVAYYQGRADAWKLAKAQHLLPNPPVEPPPGGRL